MSAEKTVKVDLVKYVDGLCGVLGLTSLFREVVQRLTAANSTGLIAALLCVEESTEAEELNISEEHSSCVTQAAAE